MNALKFCLTGDFRDILGYSLVLVFFYYLVSFACLAPSPGLIGAVAFEIGVYFCFLVYRIKRRKARSVHARQVIADTLIQSFPGGTKIAACFSAAVAVAGSTILVCALIDATSFGLAMAGQYQAASFLYSRFPVSTLAGFNPGHTMELLSGARMKAGNYAEVERLYEALFAIRVEHFGLRSERICDLYADFGDLAQRRGEFEKAEQYYVRAITLSNEIKVPQGCGKFLTRLGQMKAERGQFGEALKYLNEARSMRERIFGARSQKVADTLFVMSQVYGQMGDKKVAETLTRQALIIRNSDSSQTVNLAFYSALFTLLLMGAVYFSTSKKGWLTRFALRKLHNMADHESLSTGAYENISRQLSVLSDYARDQELSSVHADKKREPFDDLNAAGFLLSLSSQN